MARRIIAVLIMIVMGSPVLLACKNPSYTPIAALSARQARPLIEKNRGNPDFILLDIRTPQEFAQGHIPGAVLLDYHHPSFRESLQRLDRSKTYLIYCRSGNRSIRTLKFIQALGFKMIYHLADGIIDWQREAYPVAKS